jgi:hypothetical protein
MFLRRLSDGVGVVPERGGVWGRLGGHEKSWSNKGMLVHKL